MTPSAEIEPGPHWWKASALTTRPTLPESFEIWRGCRAAEVEGTECEEYVTLATLTQMLSIQESTLKSIFESFMSVNLRVDDLVKSVAEVKSSLEYTQRDVDVLGKMAAKLKDAEEEIGTL